MFKNITNLIRVTKIDVLCILFLFSVLSNNAIARPALSKDLRIVVPSEPGGNLDVLARRVSQLLSTVTGRSVIVVNRGGAGGNIGAAMVARAEPDGNTILFTGVGLLVSPMLYAQADYDPLKNLVPMLKIAEATSVLMVHESVKSFGIKGLIDPTTKLAYSSAGHGNSSHIAAEIMAYRTGASWLHVPFKGTGPASQALLAGHVQLMFVPSGSALSLAASRSVHAVAVAHSSRLDILPTIPTLNELGVKDANFSQWYGFFAPAGTPEQIIVQLSEAIYRVVSDPEFFASLKSQGIKPSVLNRREFSSFVLQQSSILSVLAKQIGLERPID